MTLTIDVFNSGYLPINGGPGWDSGSVATWPASTASLIAAEREAILVDALMTIDEGHQLASRIAEAGKSRTSIVITHGDADHFFGASPVLAAFPRTWLLALNTTVVEEARLHLQPEILENWIGWLGDEFDHEAAVPEPLGSEALTVDDNAARQLAQSRDYIKAFDEAVARSSSPRSVLNEMTGTFPDYGSLYTLFVSAHSQYQT
jgi:glyoxylase-like metal-dependent hydrolase (beta-lactamase superfamily II)